MVGPGRKEVSLGSNNKECFHKGLAGEKKIEKEEPEKVYGIRGAKVTGGFQKQGKSIPFSKYLLVNTVCQWYQMLPRRHISTQLLTAEKPLHYTHQHVYRV